MPCYVHLTFFGVFSLEIMLIWSERLNPTSDLWSSMCLLPGRRLILLLLMLLNRFSAVSLRLPGFSNMNYADRLINLNLQSLEHRRLINDLVICFKIIHGLVDIDLNDFFNISNNTTLRGHPFKLVVPIARTNLRKHFFSCRIVNVWNDHPANIVSAPSIMAFRKHLQQARF